MIELYYPVGLINKDIWQIHQNMLRQWCNRNCAGYIICDMLTTNMRWGFKIEEDATAFKLKWL